MNAPDATSLRLTQFSHGGGCGYGALNTCYELNSLATIGSQVGPDGQIQIKQALEHPRTCHRRVPAVIDLGIGNFFTSAWLEPQPIN